MKHNRFTKFTKIISILLFSFAIFLYVVTFNNSTGWWLFFFLIFLLLFDLLTLLPSLKKIELRLTGTTVFTMSEQNTITGELFRYRTVLVPLFFLELFPVLKARIERQRFYLYSGQKKELSFRWTPMQRGIDQQLSFILISSDWLGLFTKQITIDVAGPLIVQPLFQKEAAEQLSEQLLMIQPNFAVTFGTQTFMIRNFRPYQTGDPLHSIDWKQTGKRNELIIKEYEHELDVDTYFLFYGIAHQQFEEILSLYYSLIQLLNNKQAFEQVILANIPAEAPQAYLMSSIEPLSEEPDLPAFKNKKLVVFSPTSTTRLDQQLKNWDRTNETFLVTFEGDNLHLIWQDQIIPINKGGDFIAK